MAAGQVGLLTEISNIVPIPVNISSSTAISLLQASERGVWASRAREIRRGARERL